MSDKIEVRDLRQHDWVWTTKSLLYHPDVDEKMYKSYCGLAAHADNVTQEAWPSIITLSKKLHMGRSTIIRAISKLESSKFISVDRTLGEHNIYILLDIPEEKNTPKIPKIESDERPADITENFFKGVVDLQAKTESPEAISVRSFLQGLKEKYPTAPKELIWSEIKKFERYWTELNGTGTKMRWQKQETFMVERRLVTWFAKKDQFNRVEVINNKKRIV